MNKTFLIQAFQQMINQLPNTYKDGIQLYEEKKVSHVDVGYNSFDGDVGIFYTYVQLEAQPYAKCTCNKQYCTHMVALLVYAASHLDILTEVLALTPQTIPQSLTEEPKFQTTDFASSWNHYLEEKYEAWKPYNDYFEVHEIFHRFYQRAKEEGLPGLHSSSFTKAYLLLFCVEKLMNIAVDLYSRHTTNLVRHRMEEFIEELGQLPASNLLSDQYLLPMKKKMIAVLERSEYDLFFQAFTIYQLIWFNHLHIHSLLKERINVIQNYLEKGVDSNQFHLELVHLSFQLGDTEKMKEHLDYFETEYATFPFGVLEHFASYARYRNLDTKLVTILQYYAKMFMLKADEYRYSHRTLENFLHAVHGNREILDKTFYEEVMITFVPDSLSLYEEYCRENKLYRQWAEVYMLINKDPFKDHVLRRTTDKIGKEDIDTVIHLYHHFIQSYISEGYRSNYRIAARYLKKLRTLYRRKKQPDVWNDYIEKLVNQFLRLRSFMDELKKGDLI